MASYLRIAKFIKTVKKEAFQKVIIGLIIMVASVCQAFAMARGASAVFNRANTSVIAKFIAMALIAIAVKCIFIKYNEGFTKVMAAKVKGNIRTELVEKLMLLGPKYQSKSRSGSLQSLITDGVESLEMFLVNYIPQAFIAIITVVTLVSYIGTIDLTAAVIILFSVLASVISPHLSRSLSAKSCLEYWKSYAVLNAQYIDTMQGMNTLKAFNSSKAKGHELGGNCWDFYSKSIRNTALSLLDSATLVLLMGIGTSISVGIAAYHAALGQIEVANLLGILFLVPECVKPITDLNNFWHGSYLGFSVSDQFFEILDEPVTIVEKENAKETGIDDALPTIKLQDVNFKYTEDGVDILKDINIHINPGEKIAIVGKSGSGKSTIVNLLLRFYDSTSGKILYNDVDIKDYSIEYLRSKIAVVFQDTYLFYGTIEENICMAKPNATKEEIEYASKVANIHDFITSLPDGYQTIVGERGANLSGGERQRIAIARAVLKDAPFLILDEATASVDAENEKSIQDALDLLMKDKTTLVIAHRLSTIKESDRIYVLNDGVVAEQGKHNELMKLNNIYANLIKAQNKNDGGDIYAN